MRKRSARVRRKAKIGAELQRVSFCNVKSSAERQPKLTKIFSFHHRAVAQPRHFRLTLDMRCRAGVSAAKASACSPTFARSFRKSWWRDNRVCENARLEFAGKPKLARSYSACHFATLNLAQSDNQSCRKTLVSPSRSRLTTVFHDVGFAVKAWTLIELARRNAICR